MLSLVWFAAFDAAIYFAPSFAWLLALRTLFGFGMGAEWTAGTALAMARAIKSAPDFIRVREEVLAVIQHREPDANAIALDG